MLVAIFILGVISFISIKLCTKYALKDETLGFKTSLMITFITVITGIVLCAIKVCTDFNPTTWAVFTFFLLTVLYAYLTGGVHKPLLRYAAGCVLFIFGGLLSGLYYLMIRFLINLA